MIGGPVVKDFDAVAPERRQAKIAGKVLDCTFIPARVTLAIQRFSDDMAGKSGADAVERAAELIAKVGQRTDPELTVDWLLDNLDLMQLQDLFQFILEPYSRRAKEVQGNAGAAQPAE